MSIVSFLMNSKPNLDKKFEMDNSESPEYLETFERARKSNLFCDAVLTTADGEKFNVHKCVLLACSPYFMSLFAPGMLCGESGNEYLVSSLNKNTLNDLINYAYRREINLDFTNIEDILSVSKRFKISSLTKVCNSFLSGSMNSENCTAIMKLAKRFNLTELEENVRRFLKRNFMTVIEENREIKNLCLEDLISVLNSDDLNACEESSVWETIVQWIDSNKRARKKHIFDLIKCVRLGILDKRYFSREIKDHPYVSDCPECCRLVRIVTCFFKGKNSRNFSVTPEYARPRTPYELIFAIGGGNSNGITDCIEVYDIKANCWMELFETDTSGPRTCHRSVALGSDIYVIGGEDGHNYLSDCRCFNTLNKIWRAVGNMHYKRGELAVSALDGIIYSMGGYDGMYFQDSVEKYDCKNNQWTLVSSMRFARSEASSAVLSGCIYIAGGNNSTGSLSSVEFYSPLTDQWTEILPMSISRRGHSCVAYDGFLYVLGGLSTGVCVSTVEKYGPQTMSWNHVQDMLNERSYFGTEILEDKIFAIGGYSNRDINKVEYYDETLNQWFQAASMNIPRSTLSTCLVSEITNVKDYVMNRDFLLVEKGRTQRR